MKKFLFFAAMFAATATSVNATSYITLGNNVVVSPADRGQVIEVEAMAHFEEKFDSWDVELTYPDGLVGQYAYQLDGTYINYIDQNGVEQDYIVPIHVSYDCSTIICESIETTYRLNSGRWIPNGLATWEPGEYRMFMLRLYVDHAFEGGEITINSILRRHKNRTTTLYSEESSVTTKFVLGYKNGDVNGDGDVTISDVNALIDHILTGADFDAAADVDGDGEVSINDVTMLINVLISNY